MELPSVWSPRGELLPREIVAEVLYQPIIKDAAFFLVLHRIDREMAEKTRQIGCPHCGGQLHYACYQRVGCGGPADLPTAVRTRFSLCCGTEGCRRRVLPPSCLFFGRRWYWSTIVILVTTLRQEESAGLCVERLCLRFGMSRATVARWLRYFKEIFPNSLVWGRIRGRISPEVGNDALPRAWIEHLVGASQSAAEALLAVARLMATGQARSPGVDPFHAKGDFIGSK